MTDISSKKSQLSKAGKSEKVALEDVTVEEATPAFMLKRINALKNIQLKMVQHEAQFYEEMHLIECKYAGLYEPLYERRRVIVVGEVEPTEEEATWALDEAKLTEEQKAEAAKKALEPLTDEEKSIKGIENFWLETLQAFRITSEIIQDVDEPVLAYLQDLRVKYSSVKPYSYTLEFYFAENPYFTNRVLTKTYELKYDVDETDPFSYDGPDLDKAIGCKINWLPGKNVTVKMERRKLKAKNKKAPAKVIHKEVKVDSFFNFFTPPSAVKGKETPKSSGAEDNRKMSIGESSHHDDDEDQAELYRIADFEIGQYLREKVIPKAVLYYTGEYEGMEDEDYDYEDEEDDEDGEDNDDEDDDDDDEDEDEEDSDDDDDSPKKSKGAKGKKGGNKTGGQQTKGGEPTPSECKQN